MAGSSADLGKLGTLCINASRIHGSVASEGVNISGAPERGARLRPIKAQSTAVARATASICNAEWARYGGASGHGGYVHTLSDGVDENNISRYPLA